MSRTICSVGDLAQSPDDELLACLAQLRVAIHDAKRKHAAARRDARVSEDTTLEFRSFEWRPRGPQRLSLPARLSPNSTSSASRTCQPSANKSS